ncbi:MAG: fucose-binding protein [Rhizobiaceae bacterium]|nr:fucose-binding protein [Rhizobiaceae bacterium]
MLMGIDPLLPPELLMVMRAMGHGDDLLLCDRNHPAATIARHTTHGRVIHVPLPDMMDLARAILKHFPLDTFVDAPVTRMKVVNDPDRLVKAHTDMQAVANAAAGKPVLIRAIERFEFYREAQSAFVVVQTADPGPYGCFLIKKGVL